MAFSERDLGTPYTADFRAIRGKQGSSLFPNAKLIRKQRHDYKGQVVIIENAQQLRAHASAWGIGVDAGMLKTKRFASHRASEITRCAWIDDRTAVRNAPPGAVYYPAAVCFGHLYEAVVEGDVHAFHTGVKASLLGFGAGLEAFAQRHGLRFDVKATGLRRKADCDELAFDDEATFRKCFEPARGKQQTPVWVEWRVIPGREAPRGRLQWKQGKAKNCGGVAEDCRPCRRWRFTSATYSMPRNSGDIGSAAEIRVELEAPDGKLLMMYGTTANLENDPIIASAGDAVGYSAWEKDAFFDDDLGGGTVEVRDFHRDGVASGGRLGLEGVCEDF